MPPTRNRYDSAVAAFAAFARGCALWYSDEASVASFTRSRPPRNCDNSAIAAFRGRSTRRHRNHAAVALFAVEWNAFVLSRTELALHKVANWTRFHGAGFVHYEIGGAQRLLGVEEGADWLEYEADTTGTYRAAHVAGGRLQSCVFVAHGTPLPARGGAGWPYRERNEA
jgi:hypothetical protein